MNFTGHSCKPLFLSLLIELLVTSHIIKYDYQTTAADCTGVETILIIMSTDLFRMVNQAARTTMETVKYDRDLEENTRYEVLTCKRLETSVGLSTLLEFRAHPKDAPKRMWIPRRIAKIFENSDEAYTQFANNVRYFYFLGMDGKSAKFKFEFDV